MRRRVIVEEAMPTWDPAQYAQFAAERARPCRDLIAAIAVDSPQRIADLGCGPGNSTAFLAERWPNAEIVGIDSSTEMLESARGADVRARFEHVEIGVWAAQAGEWDVVFSNAALQWVPEHGALFVELMQRVSRRGLLAVQMPADSDAPAHVAARNLAASADWREQFAVPIEEWHAHPAAFYYDVLSQCASRLDIWTTEYLHILPSVESIAEWYRGSGLRPYLDALRTLTARNNFVAQYTKMLRDSFPAQPNGCVLLPFKRIFIVAYR